MTLPSFPEPVPWRNGMVLEPDHFRQTDSRTSALAHLAGMASEPWPWGFLTVGVDATALASGELRVDGEGFFPSGRPFRVRQLRRPLPDGSDGDRMDFNVVVEEDGTVALAGGTRAPGEESLPVARLVRHRDVWTGVAEWSPPAYLIGDDHPMREDMALQLGALAAIGAGFIATLRLPGADERPAARTLAQVATALAQGVGVIEALLAAPSVSPGRLGIEALRLALGVRGAAGVLDPIESRWDPADQRGSMRGLLYAAESVASSIGLPFRATVFRPGDVENVLLAQGMPSEPLLLAVESSRPADLIAARAWIEGAVLAAPERMDEAFTRRVTGCARHSVERDPRLGVSSGALLALYEVEYNVAWRGTGSVLALGRTQPPPPNTSFSVYVPDDGQGTPTARPAGSAFATASWAGAEPAGESSQP